MMLLLIRIATKTCLEMYLKSHATKEVRYYSCRSTLSCSLFSLHGFQLILGAEYGLIRLAEFEIIRVRLAPFQLGAGELR